MKRLRAIWASLTVAIGLAIIIVFIYIYRYRGNNGTGARKTMRWWFPLNGFKLERIGKFDVSANLIVMNHQSYVDIICIEGYHPSNICWVAKKQLGDTFLYGHALTAPEMILIDRENKTGLATLIKRAKTELEKGRVIAIFPEGTRGKGGKDFLPFKPGAKVLAEKYSLKIQPIVLIHTRKLYDAETLSSEGRRARLVALDAYTPDFSDKDWYVKLETTMREEYQKHYADMEGEGM